VNVVFIPGWAGGELGYVRGIFGLRYPLWLNTYAAFTGELIRLQLAPDGVSPGPLAFGAVSGPLGPIPWLYGPICAWMRSFGWNVLTPPVDWRLSWLSSGQQLLVDIQAAIGSAPFAVVAHSHGGLVARAMYAYLQAAGGDAQLTRLVTMGTPQYGTMEAVRVLCRLPTLYRIFQAACAWYLPTIPYVGPDYLDDLLASWPSLYELLPFGHYGWLYSVAPAQAADIYGSGFFDGGNPYVSSTRLASALAAQDWLQTAIPAGRMVQVVSQGYVTPQQLSPPASPLGDRGYTYDGAGDGIVGAGYATLPNVTTYPVSWPHGDLCQSPAVRQALPSLVATGQF
jgi:hypothetical protein